MDNNNSCFSNLLKVIDVLQKNTIECENINEGCTRPFLGSYTLSDIYNTRPINLYTKNGNILSANYTLNNVQSTSNVFRVEKVNDNSVKLLILAPNPDQTDQSRPYITTNTYLTVNLDCICIIQCLPDVIINLI